MILALVLIAAIALVAYVKRDQISVGSAVLGFVLAFLLLATFVGPDVQQFMTYAGSGAQDALAGLWRDVQHR